MRSITCEQYRRHTWSERTRVVILYKQVLLPCHSSSSRRSPWTGMPHPLSPPPHVLLWRAMLEADLISPHLSHITHFALYVRASPWSGVFTLPLAPPSSSPAMHALRCRAMWFTLYLWFTPWFTLFALTLLQMFGSCPRTPLLVVDFCPLISSPHFSHQKDTTDVLWILFCRILSLTPFHIHFFILAHFLLSLSLLVYFMILFVKCGIFILLLNLFLCQFLKWWPIEKRRHSLNIFTGQKARLWAVFTYIYLALVS